MPEGIRTDNFAGDRWRIHAASGAVTKKILPPLLGRANEKESVSLCPGTSVTIHCSPLLLTISL